MAIMDWSYAQHHSGVFWKKYSLSKSNCVSTVMAQTQFDIIFESPRVPQNIKKK